MIGHQVAAGDAKFAVAAIGLGLAGGLGGLLALFIGRAKWLAWAVAAVLLALSLVNVVSFPHPIWFVPVAAISLVIGALAANRIMQSRIGA
jgi:general stress protein CsbA